MARERVLNAQGKDRGGLESEPKSPKRKLDTPEENPEEKKMRMMEAKPTANISLPPEILSKVLSKTLHSRTRCALDLLVPDWEICEPSDPFPANTLDPTRVVTYTRGTGGKFGSLLTSLEHGGDDHIFLPLKSFDDRTLAINKFCRDEVFRACLLEGTQVFELAADDLPHNVAEESFLKDPEAAFPIRGKHSRAILPYDDELPGTDKRTMPSGSPFLFKLLRHIVVRSPLTLLYVRACTMVGRGVQIDNANLEALDWIIDLDRGSPIWLSWSKMPMLESVLLDLRIYSHDLNTQRKCIGKGEIIRRAQEMGRWLQLKLLVIAGLKSYSFDTSYETYSAELIEEVDEIDGEPNWIKIFSPALRPGGRLILVDKLTDRTTKFFFLNR
ncbi:hypothetical protein Daesc_001145 [Daldinia eschscholtzii]|uniref:F-box domain-containing protein n=1 Tax=Daldinia eschscholtzii TaxID=292717 RepID=A0AAX6N0P9_9PEZI